jgi:hypothetical protein
MPSANNEMLFLPFQSISFLKTIGFFVLFHWKILAALTHSLMEEGFNISLLNVIFL